MVTDPDRTRDKKTEKTAAFLALAADSGKAAGPCLSADEMAALVDGRGKAPASAASLAHLGSCRKCYEEWLLLKKETEPATPQRRPSGLHLVKKFGYVGSALAVAASIAVYLNVGNMADKTLETAVPGPAPTRDRPASPAPLRQAIGEGKKEQGPPANGQKVAGSSASPAAPALQREKVEARPAPPPPAGSGQSIARPARRIAEGAPAAGSAPPQDMAAKEADSAPPGDAELAGWLARLGEACRADRHGAEFWSEMIDHGERLRLGGGIASAAGERQRIVALLALLREMSDPGSETRQCRLILAELAKDGKTQQ